MDGTFQNEIRCDEQIVKPGKQGRAFDPVSAEVLAQHLALRARRLFMDTEKTQGSLVMTRGRLITLPEDSHSPELKDAMMPSWYGATAAWETTACEPGYMGSLRVALTGGRKVVMSDFSKWMVHQRCGANSGAEPKLEDLNISNVRNRFRDLTQDILA